MHNYIFPIKTRILKTTSLIKCISELLACFIYSYFTHQNSASRCRNGVIVTSRVVFARVISTNIIIVWRHNHIRCDRCVNAWLLQLGADQLVCLLDGLLKHHSIPHTLLARLRSVYSLATANADVSSIRMLTTCANAHVTIILLKFKHRSLRFSRSVTHRCLFACSCCVA